MDYEKVKNLMWGNRRWIRWTNCIYLQRFRGAIRIRYGYRYSHSRVMAVWYPSGKFKLVSQCYYYATRRAVNSFMPDGYYVSSYRYNSFLAKPNQDLEDARAFHIRNDNQRADGPSGWTIIHNGKVQGKLGASLKTIRAELMAADYVRDKPKRRGRYWLRKARGVYHKTCGKPYQYCNWKSLWPHPTTNWVGACGCKVWTEKHMSRDTVKAIMDEPNATVRTAKISIYGVEKFFTDAGAKTINKEAGYELVRLDTGRAYQERDRWGREQTANVVLTALRMECSTTGKTYVNTVPPQMVTVRAALDWIYNIPKYLERIGKQT